jgi:hypothetical protein
LPEKSSLSINIKELPLPSNNYFRKELKSSSAEREMVRTLPETEKEQ